MSISLGGPTVYNEFIAQYCKMNFANKLLLRVTVMHYTWVLNCLKAQITIYWQRIILSLFNFIFALSKHLLKKQLLKKTRNDYQMLDYDVQYSVCWDIKYTSLYSIDKQINHQLISNHARNFQLNFFFNHLWYCFRHQRLNFIHLIFNCCFAFLMKSFLVKWNIYTV